MAEDLLTPEARDELRARTDPDAIAARQRWPRTIVWSLLAGAANALGGVLYGLSGKEAIVIGAAISATVFLVLVAASWFLGRPVVPRLRGEGGDSLGTGE